jgi:NAD(P)-dependent dehydrogenase (short-subunit alcohol dehydrogenase family)
MSEEGVMANLCGKTAIVTGANSGMGLATVKALAEAGAHVIMLCRSSERGKEALEKLKAQGDYSLDLILCDLGDYSSIMAFAEEVKKKYDHLDILVNNAGFIALDRQETKEGMERQFGINHLGHFLLTMELLDIMGEGARIVNVASGAHKVGRIHFEDINLHKGFNVVKAYSQSKLANVLFTKELARRLKDRGITVNCCHPGAVATNMGVDRNTGFGKTITGILKPFFLTPEEGAKTAIFLATDESVKDITGEYFYRCQIAKTSRSAEDENLAKELFEYSEELVKGGSEAEKAMITIKERQQLLQSQQSELDGVETYLRLADVTSNETDARIFKELAADEGRHANVFKEYTKEVLTPGRLMANAVAILYRILGKRVLYPFIAKFEYNAIPKYEKMMEKYPEVEAVKNDEKRHGDTVRSLLKNGEYNDKPLLPFIAAGAAVLLLFTKISGKKGK